MRQDFARAYYTPLAELDAQDLAIALAEQEREGLAALAEEGVPHDSARVEHQLDVRYIGQEYTLTIPLTQANEPATDDFNTAISGRFDEAHDMRFGHANPGAPVEFVAARSTGLGDLTRAAAERLTKTTDTTDRTQTNRAIIFGRTERDAPVLQRDDLPPGSTQNGPAVIIEATATTVVPPGCTARIDDFGTIVIEIGEEE